MTENVWSVTSLVWALCRKRLQYPVSSRVLYGFGTEKLEDDVPDILAYTTAMESYVLDLTDSPQCSA